MDSFITPPEHINFMAKKLCADIGEIMDVSIAYLEAQGGGPIEKHTHRHHHLFIVVEGEAMLCMADNTIIIKENESYLVDGSIPHSVWNNLTSTTKMIGISVISPPPENKGIATN